jgi:hypothetical protein
MNLLHECFHHLSSNKKEGFLRMLSMRVYLAYIYTHYLYIRIYSMNLLIHYLSSNKNEGFLRMLSMRVYLAT